MNTSGEVTIETGVLKSRLTEAYRQLRSRGCSMSSVSHFQDLWDLKEQALLDKKEKVAVPGSWLQEIENQGMNQQGH